MVPAATGLAAGGTVAVAEAAVALAGRGVAVGTDGAVGAGVGTWAGWTETIAIGKLKFSCTTLTFQTSVYIPVAA
jgi:hypothetical protein